MKALVVGGGGREHVLVWKVLSSPHVDQVLAAPGNAGIGEVAECAEVEAEDVDGLLRLAEDEKVDLTIVGPEAPLALGIVDRFREAGLKIFGPTKEAAKIESSKVFAKELMAKYGIPTARFEVFDDPNRARDYVRKAGTPIVVKADGLAAGKGSIVCRTLDEAYGAVERIMEEKEFGDAGNLIVVEEMLVGEEASILAITDGEAIKPLLPSQDHKPVYDGDRGPNTGGMGAYAPAPVVTEEVARTVMEGILRPAVEGMAKEGTEYRGVLYAGLMITREGPKVLEFNCRFGDPESQAVLPLFEGDLVEVLEATIEGRLEEAEVRNSQGAAVCVVLASGGYPGKYEKGKVIEGLDELQDMEDVLVFHAGTAKRDGKLVTNGGRVLGVTALGPDIPRAIERAYEAVAKVHFEGMHYRRDIGRKALRHLE
ncbi:MAG: phosphoribosylamine--glycine ligase [Candidatus Latescibacterota bacterium]|nr:MAG: phosphoribosylamine--glycine ligase [Candidatus Latescibacterota bacterium]RKY72434.1 MAG: phosphoribosylamine--glycine ligase [Candidatus Latescibacterota bacterium]